MTLLHIAAGVVLGRALFQLGDVFWSRFSEWRESRAQARRQREQAEQARAEWAAVRAELLEMAARWEGGGK